MKIAVAVLMLSSALAWAGTTANPAEYTINVHVSASYIVRERDQQLNVVIDGKKYELESPGVGMLLALGDYKAKVVRDEHKEAYDSLKVYEFMFSDQKTRKFTVVGQVE